MTALGLLVLGLMFMVLGITMMLLAQLSQLILGPAAKALARQSRKLEETADAESE